MFHKKTVFILGAGSSMAYGFSSGQQLLTAARQLSIPDLASRASPIKDKQVQDLHAALAESLVSSLDAVLECRPDLNEAGRRIMASLLLEQENDAIRQKFVSNDDWLPIMFDEMSKGATTLQKFCRNPISFVTFSYDRLLEYRLLGALRARYGCPTEECVDAIRRLAIVHLHGDLGSLPELAESGVPFGVFPRAVTIETWMREHIHRAADRIQVVHNADPSTAAFRNARRVLAQAEQIVLLGFGFGENNLKRLHVKKWNDKATIVGTAYGMTKAEQVYNGIRPLSVRPCGYSNTRLEGFTCSRMLREFISMFRKEGITMDDLRRPPFRD